MVFRFLIRLYNYHLSPDRNFARRLRSILGFTPVNLSIFKLAFYHKSTSNEKLQSIQSNERLEYLGDAILGTIVAEYLFKKYPNSNEGFLTKMRSKIVKRSSLNKIADKMGLDVFLSHYNNTRLSRSMLGNALEALVGSIYLECGYQGTRDYVTQKILRGYLDIHELESYDDNYKSQLLEWCQKNGQSVAYKMLAKYKYEKRDRFKVAVLIDGEKLATADDFNKKSAEQTASEKALRILGIIDDSDNNEEENLKNAPGKSSGQKRSSSRYDDKEKPKNKQNRTKRSPKHKSIKKDQVTSLPANNTEDTSVSSNNDNSTKTIDTEKEKIDLRPDNQHTRPQVPKQKSNSKKQQRSTSDSTQTKAKSTNPTTKEGDPPKEKNASPPKIEMEDIEEISVNIDMPTETAAPVNKVNQPPLPDNPSIISDKPKDLEKGGE